MAQIEADDPEKHERVAKALEQINGLRYRYTGSSPKPEKKDINVDSDEDEDDANDRYGGRVEAKPSQRRSSSIASQQPQKGDRLLTLDEHIERMLLHTRTVALLKIANNTADVLPDDEDDEEDVDFLDEAAEAYDGDAYDHDGSFTTRSDEGLDSDESADRFDSLGATSGASSPLGGSHSSSLHRIASTRRPTSFRTASFRSSSGGGGGPVDAEAAAALRLVRKLSTFLNLPKVISYKDLEEITESLLDEPHDESEEYAHLIDEHVDSARDSMGGDSATTATDHYRPNASTRSLGLRHMASQKSLRELNIDDDPEDLELQQRRLFVENAGLRRYSSKKLVGASSRNMLRGSSKQLLIHSSPSASSRDMLGHKESKRGLTSGESWRSGGGPGSITSLLEESEDKDDDGELMRSEVADGVFGTTFDEHGYKQWRTEIKDDYLEWIRAKLEAKKLRRLQKQKDAADKKPRWQLLYEAASKGRPSSAGDDPAAAAQPRKTSAATAKRLAARQSIT